MERPKTLISLRILEITVPVTTERANQGNQKNGHSYREKTRRGTVQSTGNNATKPSSTSLKNRDEIDAAAIFDKVFEEKPLAREAAQLAITEERVQKKSP